MNSRDFNIHNWIEANNRDEMILNRERTFCTRNIEGIYQHKDYMSVLLLIFTESTDTTSPSFFTVKIASTKNPLPIEIGYTYTMSLQREIQN